MISPLLVTILSSAAYTHDQSVMADSNFECSYSSYNTIQFYECTTHSFVFFFCYLKICFITNGNESQDSSTRQLGMQKYDSKLNLLSVREQNAKGSNSEQRFVPCIIIIDGFKPCSKLGLRIT